MSLDKYINDYLDGNLTPEDDKRFRDLMSSDFSAKEEFASMLSIHSLLKSDAESISLPKELEEKVEERVLANFLQVVPVVEHRRMVRSRAIVSVLATIFFIFFVLNVIDDGTVTKSNIIFLSELNKQEQMLWNSYRIDANSDHRDNFASLPSPSDARRRKNRSSTVVAVNQQQSPRVSQTNPVVSAEEQTINNATNETTQIVSNPLNILSSDVLDFDYELRNPLPKTNLTNELRFNKWVVPFSNQIALAVPMFELQSDELLVSAFSSNAIVKFGMQDVQTKGFGSFSQSIGYKISEYERFGLEFGYSEFSWNENSVIVVPLSTVEASRRTITTIKNSDVKWSNQILTNGEGSAEPAYVQFPIQLQRERQLYWGSLFYEYYYPVERYVSFAGRLNLGATNDGPFGAVRLYSEIEPIRGIALNVGIESRTLWARMPYYKKGAFKSSIGLIYGLSLKFNFE